MAAHLCALTGGRSRGPSPEMGTVEAAEYLGRSPRTLAQWRHYREGPAYLKGPNGRVTYRQDDLDEWKRDTAPAEALAHLSEEDRMVLDALG
jgi:hypothetical protein